MLPLISAVSEILSVLKNPTRLKILFLLSQGEKTYSELMRDVTEDSGKLAFHLRALKDFFAMEDGIYRLSPLGERLYKFLEGMEDVLMIVYAKPALEIFVKEDGSAVAEVRAEYVSPSKSILADFFSFVGPARSFIELFVEKKTSQMFGCKTKLHIESIDYEEGKLKAQGRLEIERFAGCEGRVWKIHYTPSTIISEVQNLPWDVEGSVGITIHFPPKSRLVKRMEDMEMTGEGYSISARGVVEEEALKINFQISKKKGISVPEEVLEMVFIDMEYEMIE